MSKVQLLNAEQRRKRRVRGRLPQTGLRLSVFRSNRYLFAQIIEQKTGKTLFGLFEKKALSEKEKEGKTKIERAKLFGQKFAQEALKKKFQTLIFDRGPYHYHGRIKAFVEALREGGIKI